MSVVTSEMISNNDGCEFFNIPKNCFHCGERLLNLPLIVWQGESGQIWFHPDCAERIACALFRDALEVNISKEHANEWYFDIKRSNFGK